MAITVKQIEWLARPENFKAFSSLCLKIRTKSDGIIPFELNRTQEYVRQRLDDQKRRTGKVRAVIMKGRQQGVSTYISARFYHIVSNNIGLRCFIMAHDKPASLNLFGMASTYHKYFPAQIKPKATTDSANELAFNSLDSGYKVATAGSGDSGRSQTIQLFHGSEVAYWANSDAIATGALQAVPDGINSEVILESTANGMGNFFYSKAMDALKGEGDYELIFCPWWWDDGYQTPIPNDFILSEEEKEYKAHNNLTDEQIHWRRRKIKDFSGDIWKFKQEYPANPTEAFQGNVDDVFIPAEIILNARKNIVDATVAYAPLILGVDPAWKGKDRTAIAYRTGRKLHKVDVVKINNLMALAGHVANIIDRDCPAKLFLDVVGIGAGLYDRLVELGYGDVVIAVNGGSKATKIDRYVNKRAEMWGEMKAWLEDEIPVDIPDDDELHADLMAPQYEYDSNTRIKLEGKKEMRSRGIRSPDLADALGLTFAYPVSSNALARRKISVKSSGKTMQQMKRR